jgi:hypothetical protein
MKKLWQYPLIPFLIAFDYLIQFVIYLVYVQVRILKAPLTKTALKPLKEWTKTPRKDFASLVIFWSVLASILWLPWYWTLAVILFYLVTFAAALIYSFRKVLKN